MEENKNIVRSIRASEADLEKLKQIAETNGMNQGEALAHLVQIYELEGAKEKLPGSADLVNDFQKNVSNLQNTLIYALDRCYSADERAEATAADKIKAKEKTITDLQEQTEKLKLELQAVGERAAGSDARAAELTAQLEAATEALKTAQDALKDKQTIINTLEGEKAKNEAHRADYEHIKTICEDLKAKLAASEARASDLEKKIINIEAEHKNALQAAANEKERAVLGAKAESQKKFEAFTEKYSAKLDELEIRNKEIAELKAQLSKLQK